MKIERRLCLIFVCLALVFTASAGAASFNLYSGDGVGEFNNLTGTNLVIEPHRVWGAIEGAEWIGAEDTGYGGVVIPNTAIPGLPSVIFYERFWLAGDINSGGMVIGADDTAGVSIINAMFPGGYGLAVPNPIQDAHCAFGTIGCQPGEFGNLELTGFLSSGWNTVQIEAFQRGSATFGVIYKIELESNYSGIPEPATFAITGLLLVVLTSFWKRRTRRATQ